MDEKKEELSNERRFLHDIATPISIVRLHTRRLLKLCTDKPGGEIEKQLLSQILDAVTMMETLHADHKLKIHAKKAS